MKKMMKFLKVSLFFTTFAFFFIPDISYGQPLLDQPAYNGKLTNAGWGAIKTPEEHQRDLISAATGGAKNLQEYNQLIGYTKDISAGSSGTSVNTDAGGGTGTGTGNVNIFAILKAKIYSTLVDLRKIVYVIAGFGLVMFAVLAIFNKVSYKHLGYIMISLCLLSLMFPFLEYFSGQGTIQAASQTQMDFKNFLDTKYAVIQGTGEDEIQSAMNGKGQGGPSCNGKEGCEDEQLAMLLPDTSTLTVNTVNAEDALKGGMKNMKAFSDAGCPPSGGKGAWKADGTRSVCSTDASGNPVITQEQCTGRMNDKGKCVKTPAQGWNDFINGVTQTANFAAGGVNAVVGVASTGAALVSGGTNTVNAMKELGNAGNVHDVLAGLQNVAGATSGAATGVTLGLQATLSGLGGAASSVGALATIAATNPETNPTGANSVVTGAANFNQNLNTANENLGTNLGATNKALGEGARVIRDADNTVTTVEQGAKTVGGIVRQMTGK